MGLTEIIPTTKSEAVQFADRLIQSVMDGNMNALELHVKLTAMTKAIDDVKSRLRDVTLDEAAKYGSKSFEAYTAKIELAELGTKYNYEACCDPLWNEANQQVNQWAAKRKERESFLKTLKETTVIASESTGGEQVTIHPCIKSSTTGIKITLI